VLVSAHIAASVWTRIETSLLPPLKTVWTFYLISVAEDARFELARACTQHAFQVCGYASAPARRSPPPGTAAPHGRPRTAPNAGE